MPSARGGLYRGLDPLRGLEELLPRIRAFRPDSVLLTGDVSEDGSPASYRAVASRLAETAVPVLALPGNHDDPGEMQKHFETGPWSGPRFVTLGDWLIVLLDSTGRDRIDGVLHEADLSALSKGLESRDVRHVLVALHHQPMPVDSHWIDRYPLENPERFRGLLEKDGRVRCVAWGHVHQDFVSEDDGIVWLGSPSSVANGLPGYEKFTLDPAGPACRWLRLEPDGRVETGLLRPENMESE